MFGSERNQAKRQHMMCRLFRYRAAQAKLHVDGARPMLPLSRPRGINLPPTKEHIAPSIDLPGGSFR
jgi:hypothetical protein